MEQVNALETKLAKIKAEFDNGGNDIIVWKDDCRKITESVFQIQDAAKCVVDAADVVRAATEAVELIHKAWWQARESYYMELVQSKAYGLSEASLVAYRGALRELIELASETDRRLGEYLDPWKKQNETTD